MSGIQRNIGVHMSDEEYKQCEPADVAAFMSPVPTQVVSNGEYNPLPQTKEQAQVESLIKEMADREAKRQGMDRRRFLATAAGMATAFVAMNKVFGPIFDVTEAEARDMDMAKARAGSLSNQFIFDVQTHFVRDDFKQDGLLALTKWAVGAKVNPDINSVPMTLGRVKMENYLKEIFLDSDTKVALISGSPSDIPQDWFLTNEMKAEARARVNRDAGSRRMLSHAIFTPGQPGWLESIDRVIADLKPDSFKGYTIGDNTNKQISTYPWRMDDEKVAYKGYEKFLRAGLVNVCVHKGLFPPSIEQQFPHLLAYSDVRDVGRAAKDWPQLNFVIYHSAYRFAGGGKVEDAWAQFEKTGRIEWVTDLAEIPSKYGVTNVYGDLGQIFAQSTVADPRVCAAMLGQLIRGLGADHVVWGSDAIWTGSPQWQIEALRRLEIPEDMQKKYGFKPLGPADGPVKTAIFGETNARLYKYERRTALATDRIAALKEEYEKSGPARSNLRYGYVVRT